MALLDSLGSLLNPLIARLKAALGPFGKLFDLLGKFWTNIKELVPKAQNLISGIISEIAAWKNFALSVPYRTGVINLPKAVEQTAALVAQIKAAWLSIVDLAQQIQKQFSGQVESPTEEAEAAVKDIESGGVKAFLEKFPQLAKSLEKLVGFVAVLVGALESITAAIDDLTAILEAITAVREEIETGSTVFLQQKNPRKSVQLVDGGSMHIRVGSLH